MSFMLGTAAGGQKKVQSKTRDFKQSNTSVTVAPKPVVVMVEVTGSRIPQRVVLQGQQVNSGSPLYIVRGEELNRTGATSVLGMLSLDPSISRRR